ncbi:MAG: glycosyltransferase family protein [Methanomicrobiales archaeon]|nr:glycosyltransferase family protein [Methanomicrobiales archaeon]
MKTAAIIEARMTSTRLPGKVLFPVLGRPLLAHLVERLERAGTLDAIIVATTVNAADDPIADLAEELPVGCFRGSELDVLDRVLRAAEAGRVDTIVEVTGDCPLIDPAIVDRVVETYQAGSADYVSNTLERTFPRGMDTQVFSRAVLSEVSRLTADPVDHEHVSLYIYEHPERFSLRNVGSGLPPGCGDLRLTLDTPEDFTLIRTIFEELCPVKKDFGLGDILELFRRRPELPLINRHVMQKKVR